MATPNRGATARPDGWALRRERIAKHIERTALELIALNGPANVTVEQIAEASGISVRTFFRYFQTRDDVMGALPKRQNESLFARVKERPKSERVLDAFIGAIRDSSETEEDEELILLWGKARRYWSIDVPAAWMIAEYAGVIAQRMEASADDLRVQVMATAIGNVMWVAFIQWLNSDGRRSLNSVVAECFDVLADLNPSTTPSGSRRRSARLSW